MVVVYFVPEWFFKASITLELIFAAITFAISFYAYKIYKLSQQREHYLFSVGFLLTAASYVIWALLNIFLLSHIDNNLLVLAIEKVNFLKTYTLYTHIILLMVGLSTLIYTTIKTKSKRLFLIINALAILPILASENTVSVFYLTTSILLAYLVIHYINEYQIGRQKKTALVMLVFLFIFFGSLDFTLGSGTALYYALGHILKAIGYILLLASLFIIMYYGKKKNKT